MTDPVYEAPAAPSAKAEAHFADAFRFMTDCWDVHHALETGTARFVLLDVCSPALYEAGHVPGALSLPHGKIIAADGREAG